MPARVESVERSQPGTTRLRPSCWRLLLLVWAHKAARYQRCCVRLDASCFAGRSAGMCRSCLRLNRSQNSSCKPLDGRGWELCSRTLLRSPAQCGRSHVVGINSCVGSDSCRLSLGRPDKPQRELVEGQGAFGWCACIVTTSPRMSGGGHQLCSCLGKGCARCFCGSDRSSQAQLALFFIQQGTQAA